VLKGCFATHGNKIYASDWSGFCKHQVADHWLISSPSRVSIEIIDLSLDVS